MREWPLNQPQVFRIEASELGWQGTARQFRVAGMTVRLAKAIEQKARSLGITDIDITPVSEGWNPSVPYALTTETVTPAQHQAADKLIAYIDGLTDALSGEYGRQDEPVEIRRADLAAVVEALDSGFPLPLLVNGQAAMNRLREALGR